MNRRSVLNALMLAGMTGALCCLGTVARSAFADQLQPPSDAPGDIAPPAGNKVFLIVHAVGTQNYTCTSAGTWPFPGVPQANLYDDNGHQIGIHFAGPTWQLKDGSSVVGMKVAQYVKDKNSVPWLLLQAKVTSAGPDGDRLVKTTYIQRVHTSSGMPPDGGCTTGTTANIPYEADYYFYCASNGN